MNAKIYKCTNKECLSIFRTKQVPSEYGFLCCLYCGKNLTLLDPYTCNYCNTYHEHGNLGVTTCRNCNR